jgi:polar amino acid transport system substrate-binding protein
MQCKDAAADRRGRGGIDMQRLVARSTITSTLLGALLACALPALADNGVLDRVKATGKLNLGYRTDARPFSFTGSMGAPDGYTVALCKLIVAQIKKELDQPDLSVEWVAVTLDRRFEELKQSKVDLLCGADSETLARRKELTFSLPVFPGGVGALLRADAPQQLRETLEGEVDRTKPLWRGTVQQSLDKRTFSVVRDTFGERWLKERIGEFRLTATTVPVPSYELGVQRVVDRKSDVLFGDRAILLDVAKHSAPGASTAVLNRQFTYEPLALAMRQCDEPFRFIVDRTLSQTYRSADFQKLYADSFGAPDAETLDFFRIIALPD